MKTFLAIALSIALTSTAIAQTTLPDPVTIKVSRQALQVIGNGLAELPLKTAAPILNDLQAQLNAADKAAEAAAAKPPEPPSAATPSAPAASPPQK